MNDVLLDKVGFKDAESALVTLKQIPTNVAPFIQNIQNTFVFSSFIYIRVSFEFQGHLSVIRASVANVNVAPNKC